VELRKRKRHTIFDVRDKIRAESEREIGRGMKKIHGFEEYKSPLVVGNR